MQTIDIADDTLYKIWGQGQEKDDEYKVMLPTANFCPTELQVMNR